MKKKQFQQILRMHKSGVGTLTCVQAILELEPSKIEAAQSIDDFYAITLQQQLLQKTDLSIYDKYATAQNALIALGWSESAAIELLKGES